MVSMDSGDTRSWPAHESYSSEEYFQRMLILERWRSQQTGRPFLLILLDIRRLINGKRTEKAFVLKRLMAVLNSSTRTIDVKGWYMHDTVIGIICQDIQGHNGTTVYGRIKDSLHEQGVLHLTGNTANAIKFLCLLYPDP
jgi:hypothetical protein